MDRSGNGFRTALAVCLGFFLFGCSHKDSHKQAAISSYSSYFTDKRSYENFFVNQNVIPSSDTVRGLILPHHLAVGHDLARAYLAAANTHPSVVVLIGPDHFRATKEAAVTSPLPHETPYGELVADQHIIDELIHNGIKVDETIFQHEHSITSHTAFIKRQFPQATIVPIIVHPTLGMGKSEALGTLLDRILPKDALVIASVDFVHNTPEYVSLFHDESAIDQLSTSDISSFERIDADCPTCLIAIGKFLKQRKATKVLYTARTSIAEASGSPEIPANTSHVYAAYTDGNSDINSYNGISMLFLGDFILDRGVAEKVRMESNWLGGLGDKDGKFFLGPDIVGMNVEGPVTKNTCLAKLTICLRQDPSLFFQFLRKYPMFNLAFFANNHARDAGEKGIKDTYSFLDSSQVLSVGIQRECGQYKIRKKKISFCDFDDSNGSLDIKYAAQKVRAASKDSAIVIASVHWGIEYSTKPTERQKLVATALIEAGANAIIGHGPHVVQPMEFIKESPVFYSLGNFLFDQPDQNLSSGLAVGLLINDKETKVFLYPLGTTSAKPSLLQGEDRRKALQQILPVIYEGQAQNLMGTVEMQKR